MTNDSFQDARNDLQRTFMSYMGLEILEAYAREDQLGTEEQLRTDLINLLYVLPITVRDKVEDSSR